MLAGMQKKNYQKKSGQWAVRTVCVVAAAVLLASCGSTRRTYLADGNQGYLVSCKGFLNSWESCLVKAGKICGSRGYNTVRSEQYDRALVIACKAPNATASATP
jgi:hypothetical protein